MLVGDGMAEWTKGQTTGLARQLGLWVHNGVVSVKIEIEIRKAWSFGGEWEGDTHDMSITQYMFNFVSYLFT